MTPFTNPISANQQLLTGTLSVVVDTQRNLLQLLAESTPLLKPHLDKLVTQFEQSVAQVEGSAQRAVLEGRGIKGHVRTLGSLPVSQEDADGALPQVAAEPATGDLVLKTFYRGIAMHTEQNGQIAWAAPFKDTFGRAVKKALSAEEATSINPTELTTGIYPVQEGEDLRGFIVVVCVDDGTLVVMSTMSAPQLFTYVAQEEEWIAHTQWDYLSMPAFNNAINKMLTGGVGSFSFDEKKWTSLFRKLPPSAREQLGAVTLEDGSVEIRIDDYLSLIHDFQGSARLSVDTTFGGDRDENSIQAFVADQQYRYSYPFLNAKLKQLEAKFADHTTGKPIDVSSKMPAVKKVSKVRTAPTR